jgi:hypothetical protein
MPGFKIGRWLVKKRDFNTRYNHNHTSKITDTIVKYDRVGMLHTTGWVWARNKDMVDLQVSSTLAMFR